VLSRSTRDDEVFAVRRIARAGQRGARKGAVGKVRGGHNAQLERRVGTTVGTFCCEWRVAWAVRKAWQ